MKKGILVLVLATFVGNTVRASAQIQRSKLGAGLLLGGSQLKGDIRKDNTNFTGGLILRFTPVPLFSLTATSTYGKMTSGLNAFRTEVIKGSLSGNLFFLPTKRFSPLLTVGLSGLHFVTMDGDEHPLLRLDGTPLSGWETALRLGLGMEVFVAERWAINTTADYYFTQGDELDAINQGKNDGFFQALVGVLHYFKKPKNIRKPEDEHSKPRNKIWETADVSKSLEPKNLLSSKALNQDLEKLKTVPIDTTHPIEQESESKDNEEMVADGIYFEAGTANILKKSSSRLQKIYQSLLENPDNEIILRESKENQYRDENDRRLAYERAKAIKTYLVNLGIKPDRILIDTEP